MNTAEVATQAISMNVGMDTVLLILLGVFMLILTLAVDTRRSFFQWIHLNLDEESATSRTTTYLFFAGTALCFWRSTGLALALVLCTIVHFILHPAHWRYVIAQAKLYLPGVLTTILDFLKRWIPVVFMMTVGLVKSVVVFLYNASCEVIRAYQERRRSSRYTNNDWSAPVPRPRPHRPDETAPYGQPLSQYAEPYRHQPATPTPPQPTSLDTVETNLTAVTLRLTQITARHVALKAAWQEALEIYLLNSLPQPVDDNLFPELEQWRDRLHDILRSLLSKEQQTQSQITGVESGIASLKQRVEEVGLADETSFSAVSQLESQLTDARAQYTALMTAAAHESKDNDDTVRAIRTTVTKILRHKPVDLDQLNVVIGQLRTYLG